MKITSIGFQNPFYPNYMNPIKLNSLKEINILIGKNNTGKTTLLKTIYHELRKDWTPERKLIRYEIEIDLIELKLLLEKIKEKFKGFEKTFVDSFNMILSEFDELSDLVVDLKELTYIISFNRKANSDSLILNYKTINPYENNSKIKQLINTTEKIFSMISKKSKRILQFLNSILPKNQIVMIPSLRRFYSSTYTYNADNVYKVNDLIKKMMESSYDSLITGLYDDLDHNVFVIPDLSLILNRIKDNRYVQYNKINKNFLKKMFNFFNIVFPEINLEITIKDEFSIKGFFNEYGFEIDNWDKLGNGTQQFISFLLLFMLPRNCIYLIDEPENGLHPELQQIFLKFIKDVVLTDKMYTKQFFFATHSASFIDFSVPANVLLLSKSSKEIVINPINEINFQIIREDLGYSPSALFQSNGIIWVEGSSEKDYVKMLLSCFGYDVEKERIMIVPFFGDNNLISGHLTFDILKQINPNFSVMMDSDKSDKNMQINKKKSLCKEDFESKGIKFWLYKEFRDIEGILPQEFLNYHFKIDTNKGPDYKKGPFEKLKDYVDRLKKNGYIENEAPNYRKTRDSKKFSKIILKNKKYVDDIKNNDYIEKNITQIMDSLKSESTQQKYNFKL